MAPRGGRHLVPNSVAALTRGAFRAMAMARRPRQPGQRGARVFHPDGIGFAAKLEMTGTEHAKGTLLSERETHPAVVRLSRAAGLRSPLPDVLGVALRLVDARGPGEHQDLLFVSSAQSPLVRHALLPGLGGFFEQFFSSLWPYKAGKELRMLGLAPVNGGRSPADLEDLARIAQGRRYRLCVAAFGDPWRTVGELELGARLPDRVVEEMRFNPWNASEKLRPFGPLMGLRDAAYRGSQRGRLAAKRRQPDPVAIEGNGHTAANGRGGGRLSRGRARARG